MTIQTILETKNEVSS